MIILVASFSFKIYTALLCTNSSIYMCINLYDSLFLYSISIWNVRFENSKLSKTLKPSFTGPGPVILYPPQQYHGFKIFESLMYRVNLLLF